MEVNETELVEADASTSVINSLEQQVSNVQENPENFTDVQDNVGVKAVKFDPELTKSITFINLIPEEFTGSDVLNTDLSEENAQLYNERSEVLLNRSASSIYIPSNILEIALQEQPNLTQVPISFFLYKDSRLFQTSKKPPTGSPDLNVTLREAILSQVIAATLEIDNVVVENLPPNSSVISRFQLSESLNANETILYRKCVFWVSPERSAEDSYWSEEGCHMTVDGNQTVCTCNHLTSFAVLVGIGTALPPAAMITLTVITWVGSCLSITGLIVCCLTLVLIRKLRRKQASQIHLNLFVCLIGFYITFLVGDLLKDNPVHCKNVAASIQYFCLATVGWMSAEAVNMYYRLVRRKNIAYFIPISCVIIYGLSLVPVIVVFTISTFESEGYCFLPPGNSLYYGFLLEILIMTLFNMIIFSIVVRKVVFRPVMSTSSTSSRKEVISRIQMLVTFWILLGLSWSFGFLAVIPNRKTITFEVLFCIFTSLQGLILVVTIYVKNPEIHEAFKGTKKLFWMKIGSSDMKSTNSDGVPSFSELVKLQSFKKSGELKNASKTDSYSTKDNN
ncbi:adhesion G-protein coupled receptor G2-like [Apostichopus japonicus]|uniref:adhesion G-protein coupled receptor G2-like n=1 Tax=Stichopus japonicus TaxID=307972 RepID=UPI003AB3153F